MLLLAGPRDAGSSPGVSWILKRESGSQGSNDWAGIEATVRLGVGATLTFLVTPMQQTSPTKGAVGPL